jgi:uncharacterized DUF497 family protein
MKPVFEYDPDKSKQNADQHGIDFEQAQQLWKVPHVFIQAKKVFGEERVGITGRLAGQVYLAIFTYRGPLIRLISCHRADARWQKEYERWVHET